MTDHPSAARIIRAITKDHNVRFAALDASPLWDGVRRSHPHLDAQACSALVEVMAATLLVQSRTFFSERLQILLKTAGRAKVLVADAWPDGGIRGMVDLSEGAEDRPWLQPPGTLQVMRSNPSGQPYIGTLAMVEGPVAAQVEAYLLKSEQIPASLTLWCDPGTGEGGGLLVEPMPDCPPERMRSLVAALDGLEVVPLWERTPDFLAGWVNTGEGAEVLAAQEVHCRCRCSREALVATLNGFGPEKLRELFADGDTLDVRCDYCGKAYALGPGDLAASGGGE